jgi:hypothetical protein
MSHVRARGAIVMALALSLTACQGSGAVQPTPSPSGVASPAPTATSAPSTSAVPTMRVDGPWIAYQWTQADGDSIYLVRPDGTDQHALLPDA